MSFSALPRLICQIIVIGGGLSGASAANTVLERGGRVLLLDKNAFCGGTLIFSVTF